MPLAGDLLIFGCGKMGGALLSRWLALGVPATRIAAIEPSPEIGRELAAKGIRHAVDARDLPPGLRPEVVLLAVKPQMMDAAAAAVRRFLADDTAVLSIAAGKTLGYFARALGEEAAVIRAMPNTPAAIGRGITVACANARATPAQRSLCGELLGAVGEVHWVESEDHLAAVTAVSGGGPAYVYLLMEVLAEAGIGQGLPEALARRLARVTVEGAGELSRLSPDEPATLRKSVMSPGGTTVEALKVLTGPGGLQPLFDRAIAAATARARELAD